MDYYGYGGFPPYVSVAQQRARAQKKLAQLCKQGRKVRPVVIEGRAIAQTFWGKAWCEHLESYSDYQSRLPRGRSYARNGSVIDLQLEKGKVTALVSGSELYDVTADIRPLPPARWKALIRECSGRIDSAVELLSGKLSAAVMQVLCNRGKGVFPLPEEISLACSCPDGAYLCKHLAAVLYGVGARLDAEPELLFVLRGVDKMDLLGDPGGKGSLARKKKVKHALAEEHLADIFGIELDEATKPAKAPRPKRRASRSALARRRSSL